MSPNYYFQHVALRKAIESLPVDYLNAIISSQDKKEIQRICSQIIMQNSIFNLHTPNNITFSELNGKNFLTIFFAESSFVTECRCAIICTSNKVWYFTVEISFDNKVVLGRWENGTHKNYGFYPFDMNQIENRIIKIVWDNSSETEQKKQENEMDETVYKVKVNDKDDLKSDGIVIWGEETTISEVEIVRESEEKKSDKLIIEDSNSQIKSLNEMDNIQKADNKSNIAQNNEEDIEKAEKKVNKIHILQRSIKILVAFLLAVVALFPTIMVIAKENQSIGISTAKKLSSYSSNQTIYLNSKDGENIVYLKNQYGKIINVKFKDKSRYSGYNNSEVQGKATTSEITHYFKKTIISENPPLYFFFPFFLPLYFSLVIIIAIAILILILKIKKEALSIYYRLKKIDPYIQKIVAEYKNDELAKNEFVDQRKKYLSHSIIHNKGIDKLFYIFY